MHSGEITSMNTSTERSKRLRAFVAAVVLATAATVVAARAGDAPASSGTETCQACHEDLVARYRNNVHSGPAAARALPDRPGCVSCHGNAAAHAEDPSVKTGLVTFASGREAESNRACLACHSGDERAGAFARSMHGRHRVACSDCHASPHAEPAAGLRRSKESGEEWASRPGQHLKADDAELCLSCHAEQRGRLRMPYRHPVGEKAISCVGCHDPHRDPPAGARGRNALCLSCHEDKRGPWPWEHAPVVEDCASCHESHGSVAPRLLKTAQPFLCLSCHALPDDRHGEEIGGTQYSRAIYGQCTSCHGAIHGSHEDRHLKK